MLLSFTLSPRAAANPEIGQSEIVTQVEEGMRSILAQYPHSFDILVPEIKSRLTGRGREWALVVIIYPAQHGTHPPIQCNVDVVEGWIEKTRLGLVDVFRDAGMLETKGKGIQLGSIYEAITLQLANDVQFESALHSAVTLEGISKELSTAVLNSSRMPEERQRAVELAIEAAAKAIQAIINLK